MEPREDGEDELDFMMNGWRDEYSPPIGATVQDLYQHKCWKLYHRNI